MKTVRIQPDFDSWRTVARKLLVMNIPPGELTWEDSEQQSLHEAFEPAGDFGRPGIVVPREFVTSARLVACHVDPDRWNLMYRLLWRVTREGTRSLLLHFTDPDVQRFNLMAKAVSRDRHKMTAFVRFRSIDRDGQPHYVAWHRPEHHIVELTAPFFRDRFGSMHWTILTPRKSVAWDLTALHFGSGVPAREAPQADELEALWKTYYANIFNPARIKLHAMQKEMPRRHWPTLPETELIPQLIRDAPGRVKSMVLNSKSAAPTSAHDYLPRTLALPQLRESVQACRGCELYCNATQAVFGEGPVDAQVMLVGEQPGDLEDLAGRPFVGPAGQILDEALRVVGLDRGQLYLTNAVKHFRFEERGERRIHSKPSARHMQACRPWLEGEIQVIAPQIIVALGATAAQTLLGASFQLTQQRGKFIANTRWAPLFIATFHPSALLRIPDPLRLEKAKNAFHADLRSVAVMLKTTKKAASARSTDAA